jgi:hypothetical protein
VVKGVDLRSTAGNCAWARTPQLTHGLSLLQGSRRRQTSVLFIACDLQSRQRRLQLAQAKGVYVPHGKGQVPAPHLT